jgi:acyl-coenzyme A synthetase/AMP-(fatty) acid ligase
MQKWRNLSDIVLFYAGDRPRMPAIITDAETISFGEFSDFIRKATSLLRDTGIKEGDRVGVALPNTENHFILVFALMRIGAVLTELPAVSHGNRAELIRRLGLQFLAVEDSAIPSPEVCVMPINVQWRLDVEHSRADTCDAAVEPPLVLVTSGSTGRPKGVLLPHSHFVARLDSYAEYLHDGEPPSPARPAPMILIATVAYAGYFKKTVTQICSGGPVILSGTSSTTGVISVINSWEDAICPVTPNVCRLFLNHAPREGLLLPRLRALLSAGQALFPDEKRRIIETVTPNLRESYGTSATGTISFLRSADMQEKSASVGRPWPTVMLEIVDEDDRPLPASRIGRIRTRAPGMAIGYYNEPREMLGPEGFRDGWYYPGEIGRLDQSGYLYIKGRAADLIVRNGGTLFPAEIEEVLLTHPAVQEAAVLGFPAGSSDQKVAAVVVLRHELPHDALVDHCIERLAPEKRPTGIYYMRELPKLPTGKIARTLLQDRVERHRV